MGKSVFITGASSGIGRSCALRFAETGAELILTARRHDRLQALAEQIRNTYQTTVYTLSFDVTHAGEMQSAIESLPRHLRCPDILINNAGLALGLKPFHEASYDHWDTMIDTNVKGLLNLSRFISPMMVQRGSGHIINIGSIAGKEVYPNGNIYCATKAAVDSLTKAMRIDLLPYGIRVSQVAPGAVETEFSVVRFEGDEERAKSVYAGYKPLSAGDVADVVLWVAQQPPHVNISDVLVMPAAQASASIFHKKF